MMEKEACPNLEEANERFRDVMRQRRAIHKEIETIDEEISALRVKRAKVVYQQYDLIDGPATVAAKSLSKAWNQRVFQKMQQTLPREVRDMIYAHMWDIETLFSIYAVVPMHTEGTKEEYLAMRPPYLDPDVVGLQVALEAAESWDKAASKEIPEMSTIDTLGDIKYFVCGDPFCIGLKPSAVLRELRISFQIDLLIPLDTSGSPSQQHYLDLLLQIEKKAGFKLTIRLKQRHIILKSWTRAFDMLRNVLEEFEKEGAHVRVLFQDDKQLFPPYELDLHGPIKAPDSNWKAEIKEKLESDSRIRKRHRLYCDEDKPDFDPYGEEYLTTTESEFEFDPTDPLNNFGFDDDEDYESYSAYDEYEDMYLPPDYLYDDSE